MTKRILIIGGYGNFGSFIAKHLSGDQNIKLIIAGRNEDKAKSYAATLPNEPETARLDIHQDFEKSLEQISPDIVIHTSGPFQAQDYNVAQACITQGCHYIDLADARTFVTGITELNSTAKDKDLLICSGASSVPCLTSALVDHYKPQFDKLEQIDYGISTAQQTNRGLATTSAVLSYAGKPFKTLINGEMRNIYGWQDFKFRNFWRLGSRPLGNCDIPDLDIFPERYPDLKTIRFRAGLEIKFMHLGLWFATWLVRLRLVPSLQGASKILLQISRWFDGLGSDNSGFYMEFTGTDAAGNPKHISFDLLARKGHGPYIPSIPAIILAKNIAAGKTYEAGATPCVGLITLEEYLNALGEFDIEWQEK